MSKNTTQNGHWVTIRAAAALLGRPERTIRRWAQTGKLPEDRSGHVILVNVAGHMADTMTASTTEVSAVADTLTELRAEVHHLRALLAEVRAERDYLRQLAAASTRNIALLTERTGEPRRPWWRFWQGRD